MRPPVLLPLLLALSARAEPVDFARDVQPIFAQHCTACHGAQKQKSGLRLDRKAAALKGGQDHGPALTPGQPAASPLLRFVTSPNPAERMPPKGPGLSPAEIATLTRWIQEGALWPESPDSLPLPDPLAHWSFLPLSQPTPPEPALPSWPRQTLDRFILTRLQQAGLSPAPPSDPATWLRRVFLDLTGLPPSPEQAAAFAQDSRPDAPERLVDTLLASPRYGERWAQHWLDVVRYADTHGFEVNTERPHAWPYRDYVIDALNHDTPYDQFIREQILGDATGQDAATGFLVTASVLLPGQIGADDASKRLARQDALDEIVVNVSQTFLGLSVGCARCHDHKFDPISARDYYALQAFFAGVDYEDRPWRRPDALAQTQKRDALQTRLRHLEQQLAAFEPLARPASSPPPPTQAKLNEISFPPRLAKFVRFAIHETLPHPTLGLIEPCLDEFEILTDEPIPRNVALASFGTRASASGSRTSAAHRLEHLHDGQYGNDRSWMSHQAGRGWITLELPTALPLSRIRWSRDRLGHFDDRLPTAYTLQAGLTLDSLETLASQPPLRPAIQALANTDRFPPTTAKRLRFTITRTNNLEPCLDELEVFDAENHNIALAAHGTTATSSGDKVEPGRHELKHLHDGQYGNSFSWMSSQLGQGWVELEFPTPSRIARVVWSRDRAGQFQDRLALAYRIEVADAAGTWQLLADATDRRPPPLPGAAPAPFPLPDLPDDQASPAHALLQEKIATAALLATAAAEPLVFAGKFRAPDPIHLLHRGDPEQPREPVAPAVLSALGHLTLPHDAPEASRRAALADWIASPQNPLTARVMVNRLWQGHFGVGLVETPSDFGHSGVAPSHPALLDWLAAEFIRSGWSQKHLHRLIVLSATYRQSSQATPSPGAPNPFQIDSEDRLLWHYPSRRLDAETLRDSILAASGQLNVKMGGPGFDLFDKRGGLEGFTPIEHFSGDGLRRLIYAHKVRREREAVFGAFDCPDGGQSTARRRQSTTPIQALNLFNSDFTLDQSAALAQRVLAESIVDPAPQIERVWHLVLGRPPRPSEVQDSLPLVRAHGLAALCRTLFNTNEFLSLP